MGTQIQPGDKLGKVTVERDMDAERSDGRADPAQVGLKCHCGVQTTDTARLKGRLTLRHLRRHPPQLLPTCLCCRYQRRIGLEPAGFPECKKCTACLVRFPSACGVPRGHSELIDGDENPRFASAELNTAALACSGSGKRRTDLVPLLLLLELGFCLITDGPSAPD
jgi:hypothetical protein